MTSALKEFFRREGGGWSVFSFFERWREMERERETKMLGIVPWSQLLEALAGNREKKKKIPVSLYTSRDEKIDKPNWFRIHKRHESMNDEKR